MFYNFFNLFGKNKSADSKFSEGGSVEEISYLNGRTEDGEDVYGASVRYNDKSVIIPAGNFSKSEIKERAEKVLSQLKSGTYKSPFRMSEGGGVAEGWTDDEMSDMEAQYAGGGRINDIENKIGELEEKRSNWIGSSEKRANQATPYDSDIQKLHDELKKEKEKETETYTFISASGFSGKNIEEKTANMFRKFSEKNPYASLSKFIKSLKTPAQKEAFRKLHFPTYQKNWGVKMISNKSKDTIRFKQIFSTGGGVAEGWTDAEYSEGGIIEIKGNGKERLHIQDSKQKGDITITFIDKNGSEVFEINQIAKTDIPKIKKWFLDSTLTEKKVLELKELYANGGGVAEGWTDDEMSDMEAQYVGGGGIKQKGKTNKAHDKIYKAKRVGYRYTDKFAKKHGLRPNAKPTQEHIDKYLGNGVYKEDRADRSDKSRMEQI